MKIRDGFVSNSSSSSFIVTAKTPKVRMVIDVDLEDFADYKITDKCRVVAWATEYYDTLQEALDSDPEYYWDYVRKLLRALKQGKTIYAGSVGNDYDTYGRIIYDEGWGDVSGVEVIMGE